VFFPQTWLISDEYAYINQAIAIANGERHLQFFDTILKEGLSYKYTNYPLGNAFYLSFWIKLFGKPYVFLGSLFSVLASYFMIVKTLKKLEYPVLAANLIFLYPALLFFSKTTMSGMVSLLIASLFLYLLISWENSRSKFLSLAFLATLSFWIRETNLVLLGSATLVHYFTYRKGFWWYVLGAILGLLPRLITAFIYYDDPFYFVFAESFQLQALIHNIREYLILLIIFMPGGLFLFYRYNGEYAKEIKWSAFSFILVYLFYSFNPTEYSGFKKGIILIGRFLLPLLPLFCVVAGAWLSKYKWNKTVKVSFVVLVSILIIFSSFIIHKEGEKHIKVTKQINENYLDSFVFYDHSTLTNIVRYINPLTSKIDYHADLTKLLNHDYMYSVLENHEDVVIINSLNIGNEEKLSRTAKIQDLIDQLPSTYNLKRVEEIKVAPNLSIEVLRINLAEDE